MSYPISLGDPYQEGDPGCPHCRKLRVFCRCDDEREMESQFWQQQLATDEEYDQWLNSLNGSEPTTN